MGRPAALPCDIQPSTREDRVYMVLWFRDASAGKPLYTFDARGRTMWKALHWSDPEAFGPRARLVVASRPAVLTLDAVRLVDEGAYRCRVDFKNSPTRNFQVNLTVVVPPEKLVVYDSSGQPISGPVVGPVAEGSQLVLTCHAKGGRPAASVRWLVDEVPARYGRPGVAVSRLVLGRVGRHSLHASYSCEAANSRLLPPLTRTLTLDMHLAPLSVRLVAKPQSVPAGVWVDLSCEVQGSRPAPVVTWWLGDSRLAHAQVEEVGGDPSSLVSRVRFETRPEDDGRPLRCRAENLFLPASALEDSLILAVVYPPQVSLQLGNTLNPDNIKEGDDVYFECDVRASPREHRINWLHNGNVVTQNIPAGVIVSTHSLVLQGVSRNSSGVYTCRVANTQGETSSEPVILRVHFAPGCERTEAQVVGLSPGETAHLLCRVTADPPPSVFEWQRNNALGGSEAVHAHLERGSHLLAYAVASDQDYGRAACWATNTIGRQLDPCIFQLVPAVKPSPLRNCTLRLVANGSEDALEVQCLSGHDDGLGQAFVLEAYESRTARMLLNVTSKDRPLFRVSLGDLQPSGTTTSSHLVLYAINSKGRGEPFILEDIAPGDAEKRTEPMAGTSSAGLYTMPLAAALAGSVLVVAATVFLVATTSVRNQHRPSQDPQCRQRLTLQAAAPLCSKRYIMSYTIKPTVAPGHKPDILDPARDLDDENLRLEEPENVPLNTRKSFSQNATVITTHVFLSNSLPSQSHNTSSEGRQLPRSMQCREHCRSANKRRTDRSDISTEYFIENTIPGPESYV